MTGTNFWNESVWQAASLLWKKWEEYVFESNEKFLSNQDFYPLKRRDKVYLIIRKAEYFKQQREAKAKNNDHDNKEFKEVSIELCLKKIELNI